MHTHQGNIMVTGVENFEHHSKLLYTGPARFRGTSTVHFALIRASNS